MKLIGLIGGTTWQSTVEYYRILNEYMTKKLGNLHSAKCILYSFDFKEIERLQKEHSWSEITYLIISKIRQLERIGADFIIICANTLHIHIDEIQRNVDITVLSIMDATGKEIIKNKLNRVALLGTIYTMEEEFYKKCLKENYNIDVIIPDKKDRIEINKIIYEELSKGIINPNSKKKCITIINRLILDGAQGIILGCTELPLLIKDKDIEASMFNTTLIHAKAAAEYALE